MGFMGVYCLHFFFVLFERQVKAGPVIISFNQSSSNVTGFQIKAPSLEGAWQDAHMICQHLHKISNFKSLYTFF